MLTAGERKSAGGLFGFHQGLVQTAPGARAQNISQHLQRSAVFMRAGGDVISHSDGSDVSDAAQDYCPLTVLRWFFGPGRIQLALGARYRAKVLLHEIQGLGLL